MNSAEIVKARLFKAVNAIPTEAHEIYAFLAERGITGHMGTCSACPIANYLKAELKGHAAVVHAGPEGLRAWYGLKDTQFVVLNTPEPIAQFMRRFDRGLEIKFLCPSERWSWQAEVEEREACPCGKF